MEREEKYINLFTDFGFKRVFGEEANKDILIDFLNELLPSGYDIKDLSYSKNERLPQSKEDRKAIFDVYCTSSNEEQFIVELQKARQDFFKDRSVYYASFPIQEMGKKGKWNYELQAIFTVGILNFSFKEHEKDKDKFHHIVQLKDQDCEVFYKKLHFVYVELPKFTKSLEECKSHYEKWLWLFKNLPDLSEIPASLQEHIFVKVFKISEIASLNTSERKAYEASLKYLRDLKNVVDTAFREGEEIGLQKGLQEGEEIGLQKGLQEGEEIGLQKGEEIGLQKGEEIGLQKGEEIGLQKGLAKAAAEKRQAILQMKKDGLSISLIAKYMGLTEEEVDSLDT